MDERIYSKNIIEFVTVSAEYCAFYRTCSGIGERRISR